MGSCAGRANGCGYWRSRLVAGSLLDHHGQLSSDHMRYALSFYKMAVTVGGGLALVVGGMIYDFYLAQPSIDWPIFGSIKPWQATLITVGLPGILLSSLWEQFTNPAARAWQWPTAAPRTSPTVFLLWTSFDFFGHASVSTGFSFLGRPFVYCQLRQQRLVRKCWYEIMVYQKVRPAAHSG